MSRTIHHVPESARFQYTEDNQLCRLDYRLDNNIMSIVHTSVPAALGNRGIARDLTAYALDTARSKGWKVKSFCSYADLFLERHPQYQDLLAD